MHSFGAAEDPYITNCLHRIIDLEESDKETIHLLVFLFMQFLSRSDQAFPTDEKPMARIQVIVLRHLYLLLGYSQIDKTFHVTPARLRFAIMQLLSMKVSFSYIWFCCIS